MLHIKVSTTEVKFAINKFGISKNYTYVFSDWLRWSESICNAGDLGSIPGFGRSPGEGNGYPLSYSSLENSMDRGAWKATVHVLQSQT